MNHYTPEDLARMKYYLAELEDKYVSCPNSLCLRNGIAEIRKRLGLPATVSPIDPLAEIDNLTQITAAKLRLQTQHQRSGLNQEHG